MNLNFPNGLDAAGRRSKAGLPQSYRRVTSMDISIGVVLPVYNRPDGVAAAIRSVLAQSLPASQIVIVDDCSDPPLALPGALGSDTRLTIHRLSRNSGPAASRAAGLDQLTTSHVAFLDSDDTWAPDKLLKQVELLKTLADPMTTAIATGWTWVASSGRPIDRIPRPTAQLADFLSGCWFCPGSTVIMPVAAIRRAGGIDTCLRRLEDLDLFIRFAQAGGRLEVVPSAEAVIQRGRNARRGDVDRAAVRLIAKYAPSGAAALPAHLHRRLRAWLALEQAAACRNEGDLVRMAWFLARSWFLAPRWRVQMSKSWR